jgi:hypothetical protein
MTSTKMEDVSLVAYGPVTLVWRYSRVADHSLVFDALREKVPLGTQVFGFRVTELYPRDGYIYQMVLWPSTLLDDSTTGESLAKEWRSTLQRVVTELDALSLQSGSGYCLSRWQVDFRPSQDARVLDFVKEFVHDVRLHAVTVPEDEIVFFGEIAYEYEEYKQKWRETHYAIAESGYVEHVEQVDYSEDEVGVTA